MRPDWKRELTLASLLLGFGLLILPLAIYAVGRQIVGEYAPGAGVLDLAEDIWSDLLELSFPAWTLVLSPYLLVQLIRLARFASRRQSAV